jgi:hypothetical protein
MLALPAVVLAGCLLAQRDEVSRQVRAGAYTEGVIASLDSLAAVDQRAEVFVDGIDYGMDGYGTLWPGAFSEALSTAGSDRGSRIHTMERFWETVWPRLDGGESVSCVLVRFDGPRIESRPLLLEPSRLDCGAPDTMIALGDDMSFAVQVRSYDFNTLIVTGEGVHAIALRDPFYPCSLIVLPPTRIAGDTSLFDLESQESWLLRSLGPGSPVSVCSEARIDSVILSSRRLWLEDLRDRIAAKEESSGLLH